MIKASIVQGKVHIVTDEAELIQDLSDHYAIKIIDTVGRYQYRDAKKYIEKYEILEDVLIKMNEEGIV